METPSGRCSMQALGLTFGVADTPARRKLLREIAAGLRFRKNSVSPERLLDGAVLPPAGTDAPFYIVIEVEAVSIGGDKPLKALLLSLQYDLQPTSPPPGELVTLRDAGRTTVWLEEQISQLFMPNHPNLVLATARLQLDNWVRSRPAIASVPLVLGDGLLKLTGAEYTGDASSDVQSFRFSEGRAGFQVWFDYRFSFAGMLQAWNDESARCEKFLRELL